MSVHSPTPHKPSGTDSGASAAWRDPGYKLALRARQWRIWFLPIVIALVANSWPGMASEGVTKQGRNERPPSGAAAGYQDLTLILRAAAEEPGRPSGPAILAAIPGVAVPLRRPASPNPPLVAKPLTVVIDPGHGGSDPGALAVNGIQEKDITLAAALALKRHLEMRGRYRVRLTREKDEFIPLRERINRARDSRADLFLSLHADSIDRTDVRGISVYTLSEQASDREAAQLAQRENRADAVVGLDLTGTSDDLARLLVGLAQRHTVNRSRRFANMLISRLEQDFPLIQQPHRSAGFAVLTAADVPAALIEMGYLSSTSEAQLLSSNAHRDRLTRAIASVIDSFFQTLTDTPKP